MPVPPLTLLWILEGLLDDGCLSSVSLLEMAAGGIPRLRITHEELQERSKLLIGDSCYPSGHKMVASKSYGENTDKQTPDGAIYPGGLLRLSPTTKAHMVNEERKPRRRTPREETRKPPADTSRGEKARIAHDRTSGAIASRNKAEKRTKSGQQRLLELVNHEDPQHRVLGDGLTQRKCREATRKAEPGSDHDSLKADWSRHENRKIERVLSKWTGDVTKLDPVIQTW